MEGSVEGMGEGGIGVAAVGEGVCGWNPCEVWFKLLGGCIKGEMPGWRQDRGKGCGLGHWVVVGRRVFPVLVESLRAPEESVALCAGSRVLDAGVLGTSSSSLEASVAAGTRK